MLPKSMMLILTSPDAHAERSAPQQPEAEVMWARRRRYLRPLTSRPSAQPPGETADPERGSR